MLEIQVFEHKMRRSSHRCRLLNEGLLRGMALSFLLFTFANIVFPPPCSEASDCIATEMTLSVSLKEDDKPVRTQSYLGDKDLGSDRSDHQHCSDEDCCFGCAHVLAIQTITVIAASDLRSSDEIPSNVFVPTPPLSLTDHPPRFA